MYNPVIGLSDHPDKSCTHLTPHVLVTISQTIFPVLYCTSPSLFCNYQSVLFNPFTSFTQSPQATPLWQPPVLSLCLWVCFNFVCSFIFSSDATYQWNHMVFFVLCLIDFTLHSTLSRSTHVAANAKISFFLWSCNIPSYICTIHLSFHIRNTFYFIICLFVYYAHLCGVSYVEKTTHASRILCSQKEWGPMKRYRHPELLYLDARVSEVACFQPNPQG